VALKDEQSAQVQSMGRIFRAYLSAAASVGRRRKRHYLISSLASLSLSPRIHSALLLLPFVPSPITTGYEPGQRPLTLLVFLNAVAAIPAVIATVAAWLPFPHCSLFL
jgi:hypothetical protein